MRVSIPKYQRYWVLSSAIVSGGLTIAMWELQIHVQPRAHRFRVRPRALPAFASHWQAQRSAQRLCVFDRTLLTDRCVRLGLLDVGRSNVDFILRRVLELAQRKT